MTEMLRSVAVLVHLSLMVYTWIIIARAVLTWVSPDPYNPVIRFLRAATDPLLYRIRRALPVYFGGIDFSPVAALLLIQLLDVIIGNALTNPAMWASPAAAVFGIAASILNACAEMLHILLRLYLILVIARAVISWVSPNPYNPIVRFLYAATDPVLRRIQRQLPVYYGGIDFSPIIALVVIQVLDMFVVPLLSVAAGQLVGYALQP